MDRTRPLVIVGAGGHGREVIDVARATLDGTHTCIGVVADETPDDEAIARLGAPWLGPVDALADLDADFVVAIGDPQVRRAVHERVSGWGRDVASLWHATSYRAATTRWGPGTVVLPHASVTTNVRLGRHVHVNLNATVAHDCTLGDYVTVNPGAHLNGTVTVGTGATIGSGAVVREGVTIGESATIGAGAVVLNDVAPGATVYGVPARSPHP